MSHPLHDPFVKYLHAPRACVTVALTKQKLVIQPGIESIGVAKVGTAIARWEKPVYDLEGEEINPSPGRAFWISTETFDPYHVILEL